MNKRLRGSTWELWPDGDNGVVTLRVMGSPAKGDILDARTAIAGFADANRGRPWALLSDLRAMSITTREGQEQWVANMEAYVAHGLTKWAVLTTSANAALQATVVAKSAKLQARTLVVTDEAEAIRWVEGARIWRTPAAFVSAPLVSAVPSVFARRAVVIAGGADAT